MIPAILQLVGAILLAILIFLRNDKQSIQATIPTVTVQGRKNKRIKDSIRETWLIRIGLIFVIIGYLLQIINLDNKYLLELSRTNKLLFTLIISIILSTISFFIASKIAHYKFEKIEPFDMNNDKDDYHPDGSIMVTFEDTKDNE